MVRPSVQQPDLLKDTGSAVLQYAQRGTCAFEFSKRIGSEEPLLFENFFGFRYLK